jgi:hypothetical protein
MNTRLPLVAALSFLLAVSPRAAEVVTGVTATASSQWSLDQGAQNLVNNSGLRTAGSVPGNETVTSEDITALHTYHQNAFNQWHHAGPSDPNPFITFNLGAPINPSAIHIWNGNQWGTTVDLTARGVRQFDILVSTDGTNFTEVLSDQILNKSPAQTYIAAQSFSLAGNIGITHVRLRVDSNYGDAYIGLSEVMFTHVIDPALGAPKSLDFGAVAKTGTATGVIPVSNSGPNQTLTISKVSVFGNDAEFFTVNSFPATVPAGGGTGNIHLTFKPDGYTGAFSAVLEIVSNRGGIPGTITEITLTAEVPPDPNLSAPLQAALPGTLPNASSQTIVKVKNIGLTQPLLLADVAVIGPDAAKFAVQSFPGSIPAGATGDIVVVFTPAGAEGTFEAALEINSNSGGIDGTFMPVALRAKAGLLARLSTPVITASAQAYNGDYVAANLFDGTPREFATLGRGAGTPLSRTNGSWVELDFGVPVTMDRMVFVTRGNTADVIGVSRLILSTDPVFEESDTIHVFDPTTSNGRGPVRAFPSTTARYVRWEALTSLGTYQNLGGMELRFLDTPSGWQSTPATAIAGATPFNASYALAYAVDGDAGRSPGFEYASRSLGAGMFVDFDLGSSQPVTGFDFFDRMTATDRTTAFDLLLSNDPTFTTGVTLLSFSPGGNDWGYRQAFTPVNARYIRLDATAAATPAGNNGIQEIIFYTKQPAGTPYENFITGTWGVTGTAAAPEADADSDGIANLIEFLLGSVPTQPDARVAPTMSPVGDDLSFTFRQSQAADGVAPVVRYGSDLIGWTAAVPDQNGIRMTRVPNGAGAGIDSVTFLIPRSLVPGGKAFVQLLVTQAGKGG